MQKTPLSSLSLSYPPSIFAREEDVCPTQRRDMRQELGRTFESRFPALCDSCPELFAVPIDDDGSQQIQTSDAEMLAFRGAIADFALPPDP